MPPAASAPITTATSAKPTRILASALLLGVVAVAITAGACAAAAGCVAGEAFVGWAAAPHFTQKGPDSGDPHLVQKVGIFGTREFIRLGRFYSFEFGPCLYSAAIWAIYLSISCRCSCTNLT